MNRHIYDVQEASRCIRTWQRASGLTGREIAQEAGISEAYFSDISRGKQRGSVEALAAITTILGHTLDDLLHGSDPVPQGTSGRKHLKPGYCGKRGRRGARTKQQRPGSRQDFYMLWLECPEALKAALLAYHDETSRRRERGWHDSGEGEKRQA